MTEQKQNPPADERLSKAERELVGEGPAAYSMLSLAAAVQMLKNARV